nr:MAG TPA: hypothetical protein [Caudoviricetes sp.]
MATFSFIQRVSGDYKNFSKPTFLFLAHYLAHWHQK